MISAPRFPLSRFYLITIFVVSFLYLLIRLDAKWSQSLLFGAVLFAIHMSIVVFVTTVANSAKPTKLHRLLLFVALLAKAFNLFGSIYVGIRYLGLDPVQVVCGALMCLAAMCGFFAREYFLVPNLRR
jgi:hypothetical protein